MSRRGSGCTERPRSSLLCSHLWLQLANSQMECDLHVCICVGWLTQTTSGA